MPDPQTNQDSQTPTPLFDMSKAQPIQGQPTNVGQTRPLFDMSKAQPIQATAPNAQSGEAAQKSQWNPNPGDPVAHIRTSDGQSLMIHNDDLAEAQRRDPNLSVVSRFWHGFSDPFKSAFHGVTDKPRDVDEIAAHAGGGQGGLIAYRAAKQLMDAHEAMTKAKPGDDLWRAADNFRAMATNYLLGNKHEAIMQGLSGGISAMEAAEPGTKIALDRAKQIAQGATEQGDLATPLGGVAADVAIGAGTYGLGRGVSALRGATEVGEAAEQAGNVERAATQVKQPGLARQIWQGEKVAQPAAQEALRTGAKASAAEAGAATVQPQSLRTVLEEPISSLESSAKTHYKLMDDATGGKFQPNADKLANVNQKLKAITGVDDAKEAELTAAKVRLEWQQEELFNQAAKNGVPKDVVDTARAQFRQAQALKDLDSKVFKNPNIVSGNAIHGAEETVDVSKAVKTLQKMQDDTGFGAPRLEQALGKEGAQAILKDMYAAQKAGVKAMTRQVWAKRIGKVLGFTGVGAEVIKGLASGSP